MLRSARVLRLSVADQARWLWSYYGSRLRPSAGERGCVLIDVHDGGPGAVRVAIRINGCDWYTVDEIFVQKTYRVEIEGVKRILDLGGNIGLAALYFSRLYPQAEICTVEPIPENVVLLERNLELNRLEARLVKAAAGAQDGTATFELAPDPRAHSSAGSKGIPNLKKLEVQVIGMDSLIRLTGWDEIDLLKMDIEGSETEVLADRPDWLRRVRAIIGEGHTGSGYTFDRCRADLEPMGFQVNLLKQNEGAFLFFARR